MKRINIECYTHWPLYSKGVQIFFELITFLKGICFLVFLQNLKNDVPHAITHSIRKYTSHFNILVYPRILATKNVNVVLSVNG